MDPTLISQYDAGVVPGEHPAAARTRTRMCPLGHYVLLSLRTVERANLAWRPSRTNDHILELVTLLA